MSPLLAFATAALLTAAPPQPPVKLGAPGFRAVQLQEESFQPPVGATSTFGAALAPIR